MVEFEKLWILIPLILTIVQIVFLKVCPDFQLKKKIFYIFPVIIPSILLFLPVTNQSLKAIPLLISYMVLLNLAFSDILYREVHKNVYWFLIIPALVDVAMSERILWRFLSLAVTYLLMWIYFKLGNKFGEEIGGADIKIFLILSVMYDIDLVFTFLLTAMIATVLLSVIYMAKEKSVKASTPMIVSIALAHIFISYVFLLKILV